MLPIMRFKMICLIALLLAAAGALGCGAEVAPTPLADLPEPAPTATADLMRVAPTATVGLPEPTPTAAADLSRVAPTATAAATVTVKQPVVNTNPLIPTKIPTPYPTVCFTNSDDSGTYQRCFLSWQLTKTPPKYPKLGYRLEDMALAAESGWAYAPGAADANLSSESQAVQITLSGNLDHIVEWLEINGTWIRQVDPDYIYAAVPMRLLGELSRQQGIERVEEPPFRLGSPCPPSCERRKPTLGRLPSGHSLSFLVLSNLYDPLGYRVRVNRQGDAADLAIGSCSDGQNISPAVGNGALITVAACTPGTASVDLLRYNEAIGEGAWQVYRDYEVLVDDPPLVTVSPEFSVIKAGQTRTFTVETDFDDAHPVLVVINGGYWDDPGNVSFGNCPGIQGASIILQDSDTLTITGCSKGYGSVNFYKGNVKVLEEAILVWDN